MSLVLSWPSPCSSTSTSPSTATTGTSSRAVCSATEHLGEAGRARRVRGEGGGEGRVGGAVVVSEAGVGDPALRLVVAHASIVSPGSSAPDTTPCATLVLWTR